MSSDLHTLAVIGLGYVGLPLAVEFGKHRPVIGLDIKAPRSAELRAGRDRTREVSPEDLVQAQHLRLTADPADLQAATIFVVTVPIHAHKRPDLTPLIKASETVGRVLARGDGRSVPNKALSRGIRLVGLQVTVAARKHIILGTAAR